MTNMDAIAQQLQTIWQNVLNLQEVDVNANFFQLGGDSILMIQMLSLAAEQNIHLDLTDVFDYPSIAQLSAIAAESTPMQAQTPPANAAHVAHEKVLQVIKSMTRNADIATCLPLTSMQQSILFTVLFEQAEHTTYLVQNLLKIDGPINKTLFEQAWLAVHNQYPIMTTAFVWSECDQPWQYSDRSLPLNWHNVDFSVVAQEALPIKLQELFAEDKQHYQPLEAQHLMNFTFITVSADEHYLLWSFHHLLLDGWSSQWLLDACLNAYLQLAAGKNAASLLLPESASLTNYFKYLHDRSCQSNNFWSDYLQGHKYESVFSQQRKRDHAEPLSNVVLTESLTTDVTKLLHTRARELAVSLNVLMQAAWALTMQQHYQQGDVLFGMVMSGRQLPIPGIETMLGVFINTLPVRIATQACDSFVDLVQSINKTLASLQAHAADDLTVIHQAASIPQGQQLVDHLFIFENYPVAEDDHAKLEFTIDSVHAEETTEYPLSIVIIPGEQYKLRMIHKTSYLSQQQTQALMQVYSDVLNKIAHYAESDLFIRPEKNQPVTSSYFEGATHYPNFTHIIEKFIEVANAYPQQCAVQCGNETKTYAELLQAVYQYAQVLHADGVKKGNHVAICLPRSFELVVSILATMYVGAAYIPLDPQNPESRNRYCMSSAQFCIIADEWQTRYLHNNIKLLPLSHMSAPIDATHAQLSPYKTRPHDLAYIIFTSGTTGKPKGVMVEHSSVVNYLGWCLDHYFTKTGGKTALFSSVAFDMTVTTILGSVLSATTLTIFPETQQLDMLGKSLQAGNHYHVLKMTPSHLRMLRYQVGDAELAKAISCLILGGEALMSSHLDSVLWSHNMKIINEYGPTEATVGCVVHEVRPGDLQHCAISIGLPIYNTQCYIDNNAELLIAGDPLARGYLNNAQETQQRFLVPGSIASINERVYRTGDLIEFAANGDMLCIGRIDQQVKINGYRIELAEIENVLARCPGVTGVAITVHTENSGVDSLACFVVSEKHTLLPSEIASVVRAFGQEHLPKYMQPKHIQVLDGLPVNENGKLDKKQLPSIVMITDEQVTREMNAHEQALAAVWQSLLHVEQVSIKDHFFRLGGDSILTIQLVSRAKQLGILFTVRDVFHYPVLADLVANAKFAQQSAPNQIVTFVGKQPLTPIQNWFFSLNHPKDGHFNQSILLRATKVIDLKQCNEAMQRLVVAHDVLRSAFDKKDKTQIYHNTDEIAALCDKNVVSVSVTDDNALENLLNSSQASLDIYTDSLWKCVLINFQDGSQQVLMVIHHLLIDGVSWRILLQDFNALLQDTNVSLPETTKYSQWSQFLQDYTHSDTLKNERSYWQQQLELAQSIFPKKSQNIFTYKNIETITVQFDREITTALTRQANRAFNTTINDMLLTALTVSLTGGCDRKYCALYLEGHGREDLHHDIDLSHTVGWFTTIYPVVFAACHESILDTLKNVKETLRHIPQHGLGYGLLAPTLPDINLDVCFNYLGSWDGMASASSDVLVNTDNSSGDAVASENHRQCPLDVVCEIIQSQLRVFFHFDKQYLSAEEIKKIAQTYQSVLQQLVDECLQVTVPQHTPSDFTLGTLTQQQVDFLQCEQSNIADIYELTPMQQGLILGDLVQPGLDTYIMQSVFALQADSLQTHAIEQAWQAVMRKYTILRTGFYWHDLDEPVQYVLNDVTLPWSEYDVALEEALQEERNLGIDIRKAPLFRLACVKNSNDAIYLIVTHHHAIFDAWCWSLVWSDVITAYTQLTQRQLPTLSITRPYRDYVVWLRNKNQQQAINKWQAALVGYEPSYLPVDYGQSIVSDLSFSENHLELNQFAEPLSAAARHNGVTVNILLQFVWALLLTKYTRKNDVCYGLVNSGRDIDLANVTGILGPFVQLLPVRCQVVGEESLQTQLSQLQNSVSDLSQFGYISLADIQTTAKLNQPAPLFDSVLVFENQHNELDLSNRELVVNAIQGIGRNEYPLTLVIMAGETLNITFKYDHAHFADTTIQRVSKHFADLLANILQDDAQTIADIRFSGVKVAHYHPQHQALFDQYDAIDRGVYHSFVDRVNLSPEKTCIKMLNQSFTYAQCYLRVQQFTSLLVTEGVKQGNSVGVILDRGMDAIAAMLAIFSIGAIYVPINHKFPETVISNLLIDAGVKFTLTTMNVPDKATKILPNLTDHFVNPNNSDKAFIIYTSGTTGTPKGVLGTHNVIHARLSWMWQQFPFVESDVVAQFAPTHTIDCFWEMLGPLLKGTLLVVPDEVTLLEPVNFVQWLGDHNVTRLDMVPSFLNMLLAEGGPLAQALPKLHYWGINGDSFSEKLVKQFFQALPKAILLNRFGATEATSVYCQMYHYDSTTDSIHTNAFITPHAAICVLDAFHNPLPPGIMGDLFVASATIAEGYHNNQGLTERRFIHAPHIKFGLNAKLYQTGDLAIINEQGHLQLLGREGHVTKIRGFSVNLHDIEAELMQLDQVHRAVVIVGEDQYNEKMLIAYITTRQGNIAPGMLHKALLQKVPDYMIPQQFIQLEHFPLNANGKVDRKQLSTIQSSIVDQQSVEPCDRSHHKAIIRQIWQEVLACQVVSDADSFFALGGHSLLAVRCIAKIKRHFNGVTIPLRLIFEYPKFVDFFAAVEGILPNDLIEEQQETISIMSSNNSFPASSAQKQLWFLNNILNQGCAYLMPILLHVKGALDTEAFLKALNALVERHSALRTHFEYHNQELEQVIDSGKNFKVSILSIDTKQALDAAVQTALSQPMDLTSSDVFKVSLFQLQADEHYIFIEMHHINTDRWSNAVLFKELNILYTAFASGIKIELPAVKQYYQYQAVEQELLNNGDGVSFWLEQLQGAPTALNFPLDYPRREQANTKCNQHSLTFSTTTLHRLQTIAQQSKASLSMLLLSVYYMTLSHFAKQSDIVIGMPVANRQRDEFEQTVGLFVNTLPMRCQLDQAETFNDMLARVRDKALDAFEHQMVPLDVIIEQLQLPRTTTIHPLFQFGFVSQNTPSTNLSLAGLTITELPLLQQQAKFDLLLITQEVNDQLSCVFEYSADLFDAKSITNVAAFFNICIEAIVTDSELALARFLDFSITSEAMHADNNHLGQLQNDVDIERAVHEVWCEVLSKDAIQSDDNFFVLGGSSFKAIQLVDKLNQQLNQQFGVADIFRNPTIAQIVDNIIQNNDVDEQSAIIDLNMPDIVNQEIFFVHQASGLAYPYLGIAQLLSNTAIFGISNPRYGNFSSPFLSVEEMAACYVKLIKDKTSEPYWLAGWSFGGVVALEMARQLMNEGLAVARVILIDSYNFAVRTADDNLASTRNEFIKLYLQDRGVTEESLEAKAIIFEFEQSYRLAAAYQPSPYYGNVTLIKAAAPLTTGSSRSYWEDPLNGWSNIFRGDVDVVSVLGEHNMLFEPENVGAIADIINDCTAQSQTQAENTQTIFEQIIHRAQLRNDIFILDRMLHFYDGINGPALEDKLINIIESHLEESLCH